MNSQNTLKSFNRKWCHVNSSKDILFFHCLCFILWPHSTVETDKNAHIINTYKTECQTDHKALQHIGTLNTRPNSSCVTAHIWTLFVHLFVNTVDSVVDVKILTVWSYVWQWILRKKKKVRLQQQCKIDWQFYEVV